MMRDKGKGQVGAGLCKEVCKETLAVFLIF